MAKERSIGYITDISNGTRFEPHPMDPLREDFNQHVIGPLSHVVVAHTLDVIGENFLQSAKRMRPQSYYSLHRYPPTILNQLNRKLRDEGINSIGRQEEQISDLLSPRQQAATTRFGTSIMKGHRVDAGIFSEITTVANTIEDIIARRHHELNFSYLPNLVKFLRSPQTPRIFRGFGTGGNAFVDAFRQNRHPATLPWRDEGKLKSVLDTTGAVPRITGDIREAAQTSRKINETLLDHKLSPSEQEALVNNGLVDGNAKQFSSGCPAKHVLFKTDVPDLVINKLALSSSQVDMLTAQTTPSVIEKINPSSYIIRRDAYTAVCEILATALELAA